MRILTALCTCAILAASIPAQAATLNFVYGTEYSGSGAVPGSQPFATATITDSAKDEVTITLKLFGSGGSIEDAYFNYAGSLTGAKITTSGQQVNSATVGTFKAGGGAGDFDLYIDYPPPPGLESAIFIDGETSTIKIELTGISAALFEDYSSDSEKGSFLSALHVQRLGARDNESGWFSATLGNSGGGDTAVPLPAALPLFATILAGGGLVAWRRKRKTAKVAT